MRRLLLCAVGAAATNATFGALADRVVWARVGLFGAIVAKLLR